MKGETEERTSEEVRAEIEETRVELGDTVEALVAKTDVKRQAKSAVNDAKATVADKAADAKATVVDKTTDVKQTVTDKKDGFATTAQETTPESVAETGRRAVAIARDNRAVLIIGVAFALGLLVGSRRGR